MTTTTTPTSGAAIQRYIIGYRADEWGQRSSTPSGIPDASGSWVRYADHAAVITALRAQQPAPALPVGPCVICGSDEPFTRTCGSGDPRALCRQPTPTAQASPAYKDSTPELHIGDSAFESWYSIYRPAHKSDKQRARDAYAAGMGDPLVTAAPAAVAGPSDAEPLHITHGPLMRHAAYLLRSRKPALPEHESVAEELELAADGHPTPAGDPSPEWLDVAEAAMLAAAPTTQPAPQQEPSYTSVQLAEMVLSDCGHSSNYTPLLNRVAARIDAHVERCLESKKTTQQEAQEPHGWLYEWTHSSATGRPDATYTAFTTDEAHARKHDNCRAIYTSPQPSPAAQGDALDAAFEAVRKRLCGVRRYSFVLDDDGLIRRVQDRVGNWIEFDDAHELFDPVAIDAARAAQEGANHE